MKIKSKKLFEEGEEEEFELEDSDYCLVSAILELTKEINMARKNSGR